MALERFISTELNLAGPEWVKPLHVAEAIAEARRKKKFREKRGFCPTGEGGGVENSCGPDGDPASDSGSSSSPSASSAPKGTRSVTRLDLASILKKISESPDGFTIDPASVEQPPDGIMVSEYTNDSVRSVKIRASDIETDTGAEKFAKWCVANQDLLADPSKFIGGWKTGDDFYIDVATRFEPGQASAALEAGRKAGQLAVFNLSTFKETWVKYESGDSRKPKEWDGAFQRARKDTAVKQVYDENTPGLDEEDWDSELQKHGKSTVRSYNQIQKEEQLNGRQRQQGSAVRRSVEDNGSRNVPGVPEVSGSVGRTSSVEGVVRGRPGSEAVPLRGSVSSRNLASQAARAGFTPGVALPAVEFRNTDSIASYSPESDTITVSPDVTEQDLESFQELSSRGWFSQPNPVLHEYAKRCHFLMSPGSYAKPPPFSDEQRSLVSRSVSAYAGTSVSAFVAEYLAGRLSGLAYSKPVQELLSEVTNGEISP